MHIRRKGQYGQANGRFFLLKWGEGNSGFHITSPYRYDLQKYELDVEIPVNVLRKRDKHLIPGILFLSIQCAEPDLSKPHAVSMCDDIRVYPDDIVVREFSLSTDGMCVKSTEKTLDFETALEDICRQIKSGYYIKCCFTCQYSDYSPYGNDDYGTMLCFCRHKKDYLKVKGKDDFFSFLEGKDFDVRQETYLCEHYGLRDKAEGYRGFVEGIDDFYGF